MSRATRLAALLPAEASVANPVDMLGSATAATYESVLPVLLGDHGVDAVIVPFVPPVTATADEVVDGGRTRVRRDSGQAGAGSGGQRAASPPALTGGGSLRSRIRESAARAWRGRPAPSGSGGPSGLSRASKESTAQRRARDRRRDALPRP